MTSSDHTMVTCQAAVSGCHAQARDSSVVGSRFDALTTGGMNSCAQGAGPQQRCVPRQLSAEAGAGGAGGAAARAGKRDSGSGAGRACSSVGPKPSVSSGSLCLAFKRTACSSSSSASANAPHSHASARRWNRRTQYSKAELQTDERRAPCTLRRGSRWLRSGATSAPGTTTVSNGLRRCCCWLIAASCRGWPPPLRAEPPSRERASALPRAPPS